MTLTRGDTLLGGRYRLARALNSNDTQVQLWSAEDTEEYVRPYLLKSWQFSESGPDQVQRALWDAELRSLYQVRSSPGSERSLLQLHNVGIDHEHHCFVMVFETEGHDTLASLLSEREKHSWLSGRPTDRLTLWRMLARTAEGLDLLHRQQVVHRSVSPETVFLDPDVGPESARLGGFEWSVRLGRPATAARARRGWETPPEAANGRAAFGPDADWFAFGMLAARCMLKIEHLGDTPDPAERYRLVRNQLAKPPSQASKRGRGKAPEPMNRLTPLERDAINRLIAEEPTLRLRRGDEVQAIIREVTDKLEEAPEDTEAGKKHYVVVNAKNQSLILALEAHGLRKALQMGPADAFNSQKIEHTTGLITFLLDDFSDGGTLSPGPDRGTVILSGRSLHLRLGQHIDGETKSWQRAFCLNVLDFVTVDPRLSREIPAAQIGFVTARRNQVPPDQELNWEPKIPQSDRVGQRRENQEQVAEFIRLTNQIDLLIRDAEVFRCLVSHVEVRPDGSVDHIQVEEIGRQHQPLHMFRPNDGMAAFLLRDKHSGKSDNDEIELCSPDAEGLRRTPSLSTWKLKDADISGESVRLLPVTGPAASTDHTPRNTAEAHGLFRGAQFVLRTKGLQRQLHLIRRRKKAIEGLADHTYLLESLSAPGQVFMDSDLGQLPVKLDEKTVDKGKLTQISQILGTRPIYTVQGPPGTGKTHMVAWLLREILEEDPMAQILITAQAHAAVDVLRTKVESEAFKGIPEDRRPLSIRLRKTSDPQTKDEPRSVHSVALNLLDRTVGRLEAFQEEGPLTPITADWLVACKEMRLELLTKDGTSANDFRELVRRSASITYSSTSDGDLAGLAGEVNYDWSIIEEAGKAHGFEMALPLYLGHRWLMIGDPKQLPPYRMEDYQRALSDLDLVVRTLRELEGAEGLVDRELLNRWDEKSPEERGRFTEYSKRWLTFFGQLHHLCSAHEPGDGLLTGQYRMHPHIGELVSETYYGGKLEHFTGDRPTHGLTAPAHLQDVAVVWLDLPAASDDARSAESKVPKYRNRAEAHALEMFLRSLRSGRSEPINVAVLSPYAQQVVILGDLLRRPEMRTALQKNGIVLAPDPRNAGDTSATAQGGAGKSKEGVFTVDSFQGNQSEIVAVSLVRNNTREPGQGLGFLKAASRMNVLISRAEQLLVLVGSWDFFRTQVANVPRDERQHDELRHVAVLVDRLETMFTEGRAVRITADLSGFERGEHK
ncbi:AAA domain-containing protein [Streptomyces hydrogenans]|uniref:AAA domain-containing protein n=1 Tax=Streptomyces hydrogenans TaxID=1873719 RepID=UPI003697D0A9